MMIRPAVFVLAMPFALTLGSVSAFAGEPQEAAAVAAPTATPVVPVDELASLTQREAAAPALQNFRGGDYDAVYIGGGGVGLLLLIILIILIIH